MIYLLDVSALIALGLVNHQFHGRLTDWVLQERSSIFVTCSVTEIGFVRVLSQKFAYGLSVEQAQTLLSALKRSEALSFRFIADAVDASQLPEWVKAPKQITDGHLVELAKKHGAVLATLDAKIPGAYLIA